MAYSEYLAMHKANKTFLKIYLNNSTMLTGKITDFDEDCVIVDECLVNRDHLISIKPNDDKPKRV